jgi:transposase
MMHAGLDLSRKRLDVQLLNDHGARLGHLVVPPTVEGLRDLVDQVAPFRQAIRAVIESMTGARFVHDQLELAGWEVAIADAVKVKGLAPLACKTDKIDAWVLAELSRRELIPEIWLPDPGVRAERERARWRLHLVHHRTALKNRIHQTLITFGHPCPASDLFGVSGRKRLAGITLPEPWLGSVTAALRLIDDLDQQIVECERQLRDLGADHPYIPLLRTVPGIGWLLASTIAAEIGDIHRFPSPTHLIGYTGLCPSVRQSGEHDHRGPLTKQGPRFLRWALIEAAQVAARLPTYRTRYQTMKRRLGRQRGAKVATVDLARQLTNAIWYMLIRNQPFAPGGAN